MALRGVTAEAGDAFDRASLANFQPRATIGIVSGLYELFSKNDVVAESLAGLAEAIELGGYIICTNQPWHPQVEFIARVFCAIARAALDHASAHHRGNG